MSVEERLAAIGLSLPREPQLPPGVEIPFVWVRTHGSTAYVSGHGALTADGTPAGPFGKVPSEVSLESAQESARLAALSMLSSLKRALGDLDRVAAWTTVNGFVNADAGYDRTTLVLNPFSELILELYGSEAGAHARTAIGVAALPLNLPVVVSAEIALHP